jgi:Ca2+-binding RTX toxin-like protein
MVDLPSSFVLFSPTYLTSGSTLLRSWAGSYGALYSFTSYLGTQSGLDQFSNNPVQDAFRHTFVSAALYLDKYKALTDNGMSDSAADAIATRYVLRLGNLNEVYAPNPLTNHLKDYWNNFDGILDARDIVHNVGVGISNNELANYVAAKINASREAPLGSGNAIIYTGAGTDPITGQPITVIDPRLSIQNYDVQRLPNASWEEPGLNPQQGTMVPLAIMDAFPNQYGLGPTPCFSGDVRITLVDGTQKPIREIRPGDFVQAFESQEKQGRGPAVAGEVVRLFSNVTTEWLVLSVTSGGGESFDQLTVTPGHRFLAADGRFKRIDEIVREDGLIISADGEITRVSAKRIVYSAATARLYEQAEIAEYVSTGGAALAPQIIGGWKTYNFEVKTWHTYIAGGARVHNDCVPTITGSSDQFTAIFGHEFGTSPDDPSRFIQAIADGRIQTQGEYVNSAGNDRYIGSSDVSVNRIVVSGDSAGTAVSTVSAGFLQHIMSLPVDGIRIDTAFAPDGSRIEIKTDTANSFDWNREITAIHPDFIDKIVVGDNGAISSFTWGASQISVGDIGSAFGSSLGRLLGGNSLVGQVAAGTVIGTIGKEIGNALQMGATFSLDFAVKDAFGVLGGGSGVGALPSAAIGAASSLLIGELAKALHLNGFEGGLFTTVGTTITAQLVTNAYGVATGATVNGVPGGPAYTMLTGFDPVSIATNLGAAVAGYLGSTLAAQVAMPQHAEGAIGEQVGSSVGGAIGVWFGGPVGAFIGSFVGGVAGSLIGDLAGNDPESHGRVVFYTDHLFHPDPVSFYGDHGANGYTFMNIATYTGNVVNGLADFAGVQMNATPVTTPLAISAAGLQLLYTQDDHDFMVNEPYQGPLALVHNVQSSDDLAPLIDDGIMDLVHHVTATGGDPLVRLAWVNSTATNPSAFALDLQIAKDYRTYLDDRNAINALMAAMPQSAFTAGWVLTLLKARELGLDAVPANEDFRAGNDTLNGTASADLLIGGPGNDTIHGGEGNDRLNGGPGWNALDGGGGTDIAVFAGPAAGYTRVAWSGQIFIGALNGSERDTLSGVEWLAFSDQVIAAASVPGLNVGAVNGLEYIASYPDLMAALHANAAAGVTHFLNAGIFEGRQSSFHALDYLATYPDLMAAFGADRDAGATHYINNGYNEGRHATFNGLQYIASYPDLIAAYGADRDAGDSHYILFGRNEGRHVTFEALRYIASYGDLTAAFGLNADAGAAHYIQSGYGEGRQISFDGLRYIASYPDLIDTLGANADAGVANFIQNGYGLGRTIQFDPASYLAHYPGMLGGDLTALTIHYIVLGYHEGRQWSDILGGLGNDTLPGTPGADTLIGAIGDDTYTVNGSGDVVVEYPNQGNDTVLASINYVLPADVENLTLVEGSGATSATGNGANNVIVGNSNDNLLHGGAGDDAFYGGTGNDSYYVDSQADAVIEYEDAGIDTVYASGSYALLTETENLVLVEGSAALDGTGNWLGNTITGNAHAGVLSGGAGADLLAGGAGNDTIEGGAGIDTAVFSGNRADYAIAYDGAAHSFTVTDLRATMPDGIDTVSGVEFFRFADTTIDTLSVAAQTVNHAGGTRTVTAFDVTDSLPWASHVSSYDAADRLTAETFNQDNGTAWTNAYDAAHAFPWDWSTTHFDEHGNTMSKVTANDDGTFALDVHDAGGVEDWADLAIVFDAGWNIVTQSGVRHDGNTVPVPAIAAALDLVTWHMHPI